jgi:hypothetical protein
VVKGAKKQTQAQDPKNAVWTDEVEADSHKEKKVYEDHDRQLLALIGEDARAGFLDVPGGGNGVVALALARLKSVGCSVHASDCASTA